MLQGRRTKGGTHPHQGSQGAAPAKETETFQDYKVGDEVELVTSGYYSVTSPGEVYRILKFDGDCIILDIAGYEDGLAFFSDEIKPTKEAKVLKILRQWKDTR